MSRGRRRRRRRSPERCPRTRSRQHRHPVLLGLVVALVAFNLRPAVASVGPVLPEARADLSLSGVGAAFLTFLPVLCFGLLAVAAPRLARRSGIEPVLLGMLVAVAIGLAGRVVDGPALLYLGTALAGGAIAVGNVLVPPLIKRDFPDRTGLMMGVYTMAVSGSAALAAGLTVPVGDADRLRLARRAGRVGGARRAGRRGLASAGACAHPARPASVRAVPGAQRPGLAGDHLLRAAVVVVLRRVGLAAVHLPGVRDEPGRGGTAALGGRAGADPGRSGAPAARDAGGQPGRLHRRLHRCSSGSGSPASCSPRPARPTSGRC